MQLRAGDQINHYTLLEPLGEGGQGSVWKVRDPRGGGVDRALKIVSLAETGPSSFDRARREARILADAAHPALVTCHSFFEERDGVVGLLMDLVSGCSLADAIEGQRLERAQSIAVLGHLADALAYVHGAGLMHRDLKPENVLLTDEFWEDASRAGSVKLVDFGIAVSANRDMQLTAPGAVIGTLPYLAPELVDPATWGKREGPTRDVFAFGVLACRLLLGRHPTKLGFDAAMIDYARAYKAAEAGLLPWPPSGIEGTWGVVVGACLALRPSDRPADGSALIEVIRAGVSSKKRPSSVSSTTTPYAVSTGVPRTEPMEPPARANADPVRVKTIAAAPSPLAMKPPKPHARRTLWGPLLLVGALGAAGGAVVHASLSDTPSPSAGFTPESPTVVAVPTATPASKLPADTPCRNPKLPFDPRNTRFACPPCGDKIPPLRSRDGLMRIHKVVGPTPSPDPFRKVCAQVTGGDPICVPYPDPAEPGRTGSAKRLRVTSSDIENGRVYFSIREPDNSIVAKGFARRRDGTFPYLESALCAGFILVLDDPSVPAVTITVFLDEP